MTWETVEITPAVRALVERERSLAKAEDHLHDAVRSMRLARQALGQEIVPLVVIHEVEALANRLWTWSVLTPTRALDTPPGAEPDSVPGGAA